MNGVIIVGSGKCVAERRLGYFIDKFDTVVRFSGFENRIDDFTGYKTDVIAINTSNEALKRLQDGVALHQDKKYIITYNGRVKDAKMKLDKCKKILTDNGIIWDQADISNTTWSKYLDRRYAPYCKKRNRNAKTISSGLCIIDKYLRIVNSVTIHGFDFPYYGDNLITLLHYYDEGKNGLSKFHDLKLESKIIGGRISDGNIILLDKY